MDTIITLSQFITESHFKAEEASTGLSLLLCMRLEINKSSDLELIYGEKEVRYAKEGTDYRPLREGVGRD